MSNTDRLQRIETLLDEKVIPEITALREDVHTLAEKVSNERTARLALENKGKGAFVVASLVFTSIGAFVTAFWDQIKALFH